MAAEDRPAAASTAGGVEQAGASSVGQALARYYDLDTVGEAADVALYLALAGRTGGPILELAAGTGRVCVPLAEAGYDVTGVDRDPAMLARAEAEWALRQATPVAPREAGSLRFVEADLLDLDLGDRFALVILALNTLLMLPGRDGQLAALRTMGRHLRGGGGRAVVDVWLPTPEDLVVYDGRLVADWIRHDADSEEDVAKITASRHDPATATAVVDTVFDAWPAGGGPVRRTARRDALHFLSATELRTLVEAAGLTVETAGGDYEMTEFGPGSERIVLVCALL